MLRRICQSWPSVSISRRSTRSTRLRRQSDSNVSAVTSLLTIRLSMSGMCAACLSTASRENEPMPSYQSGSVSRSSGVGSAR